MNSRMLKIIAIVTMTIDHIGYILFPFEDWYRAVGRIAMPLFCFLIAYGGTKTKNNLKYALRLLTFAVLFQAVYNLAMYETLFDFSILNVFFTLSFGALAIYCLNQEKIIYPLLVLPVICALACFFNIEYGIGGVILIILFYLFLKLPLFKKFNLNNITSQKNENNASTPHMFFFYPLITLGTLIALAIFNFILYIFDGLWYVQFYSMCAIFFIMVFKDVRLKIGKFEKWAFYGYYPLHLVVLYGVSYLI